MAKRAAQLPRRQFLKTTLAAASATFAVPTIIPSSALGLDGAVAPSERIIVGGIGIGNRGTYDLGCFLEQKDCQFVAVCDVKQSRRDAVKKIADDKYGKADCARCHTPPTYTDVLSGADPRVPLLHDPDETGVDPQYATRSATGIIRSPLYQPDGRVKCA